MSGPRTSGRQHRAVNYNEKGGGGGSAPAWALELGDQPVKENARPGAPAPPARKSGGAKQPKAPAVAQKGRDAGLERLPIADDVSGGKAVGGSKPRAQQQAGAAPAAAGKQILPGVFVKGAPPAAAARPGGGNAEAAAAEGRQPAKPAAAQAAAPARQGSGGAAGAAEARQPAKSAPAAADKAASGSGGSGGKRKATAASAGAATAGGGGAAKAPAKSAPAAAADGKRQKTAAAPAAAGPSRAQDQQQQQQAREQQRGERPTSRAAAAAAAAPADAQRAAAGDGGLALPEGGSSEELVEHYSANFWAQQAEYERLQALYEDLKAAKIDEEVQQLLEQQNRYVAEHGQKAAALVEHYKQEAAHQAALAAQLGGEAVLDQCHQLQADLMNCQQALLDKEAECLEKEKRLAEMAARLGFLERFVRVYDSSDKCVQTDDLPGEDASAQFPSIQSSGVEMLQAHAMVPEGAGGGSIYRRPRPPAGPAAPDTSYTLPAGTPLAGAAATAGAAGPSPRQAAGVDAGVGDAPISGSDMELTGEADNGQHAAQAAPQVQPAPAQQQQQRRQSLQPTAGRMAQAAGAAPAPRPASAESGVQPLQQPVRQRRASLAPAPSAGAAAAAAAAGDRRLSAPPAPLDRELHFTSASSGEGAQGHPGMLALMPPGAAQQAQQERGLQAIAEEEQEEEAAPPPFEFPQLSAGGAAAASHLTAPAGAVLRGGPAPTPGSVPAPPRHLAITALTGLTATPLKGGIYQYCDPRSGFVFELGPAPPNSTGLAGEEGGEACMRYRPVQLGGAGGLLPDYLLEEISFRESQKQAFFQQMMHSLNQQAA